MRFLLLVDTCGAVGGVAIADLARPSSQYIVEERILPGRETQERLMPAIHEVLQEAGLSPEDLDAFVVVSGPGSFTGVRIGLAAVKGLAEALHRPVIAISRLAMLASTAPAGNMVHAWLDAGRGDLYVGEFEAGRTLHERMLHPAAAMAAASHADAVVVAEPLVKATCEPAVLVPMPDLRVALRLALVDLEANRFADAALLDANYLRVPDAELALRARQGVV